jgi:type II secretory pathway component PulM
MFRRLDRRERVVVAAGAAVSVVALLVTFVVLPEYDRWAQREAAIGLRAEQLARLQAVLSEEEATRARLAELQLEQRAAERRLLAGTTAAVARSNLQLLLNRYAAQSGMEVQRVDAVGQSAGEGPLQTIPASLTVLGDIRGLVDLLLLVQQGEELLTVDDMRVGIAPGVRGDADRLSVILGLHGYHRGPGGGS